MALHAPSIRLTSIVRRGTAATEAALVMPIILFFLILAMALWTLAVLEQRTIADAASDSFAKACRFLPLSVAEAPPPFPADPLPAPPPPDIIGVGDANLLDYEEFNNFAMQGAASRYFRAFPQVAPGFGDFSINRRATLIRSPWSFFAFPRNHTQHPDERDAVLDWYELAHDATLDQATCRALGVTYLPY